MDIRNLKTQEGREFWERQNRELGIPLPNDYIRLDGSHVNENTPIMRAESLPNNQMRFSFNLDKDTRDPKSRMTST